MPVDPVQLVDPASDHEDSEYVGSWACPACAFVGTSAKGSQTHYDNKHAPQDPLVTTVFLSNCPDCKQTFVSAKEPRFRKCPAKPHHLDQLVPSPVLLPAPPSLNLANSTGWAVYTDGAGPRDGCPHAGWGVAVWEAALSSSLPDFELWGPVPLEKWDSRWMAELASNNAGELTGMLEAFLWLDTEAPGPAEALVALWFDSLCAFHAITGTHDPEANAALVLNAREIFIRFLLRDLWNGIKLRDILRTMVMTTLIT